MHILFFSLTNKKISVIFLVFLSNLSVKRDHFPDDEDVKGTAQAIMRLQDTYKLDTHEIAQGIVKGK